MPSVRADVDDLGEPASRAAAFVARTSYGRLLAVLATRWRDVAAAEDALATAFAEALESWPRTGVPDAPAAWLLAAARRNLIDVARHTAVRARPDIVARLAEDVPAPAALDLDPARLPDDRLRLLFVCAHPAIAADIRPALMLQVVLGIDARTIASALLVAPETMNKRLVRAKQKIRAAGIAFELPDEPAMSERLHAVLEAIYAAYFLGADGVDHAGHPRDSLRGEALYLAQLTARLAPDEPEVLGLAALLELAEARVPAQVDDQGDFVPLLAQDCARWDRALLERAYRRLAAAARAGRPGPFQLEAAIQGAHASRARSGTVPWPEIVVLYRTLVARFPTIGAITGMAVALAHTEAGPAAGIAALDALPEKSIASYPPYWVARAYLLARRGDRNGAHAAYVRALDLTHHPRRRRYLAAQVRALSVA